MSIVNPKLLYVYDFAAELVGDGDHAVGFDAGGEAAFGPGDNRLNGNIHTEGLADGVACQVEAFRAVEFFLQDVAGKGQDDDSITDFSQFAGIEQGSDVGVFLFDQGRDLPPRF